MRVRFYVLAIIVQYIYVDDMRASVKRRRREREYGDQI